MLNNIIAPSILSADFNILGEQLKQIEKSEAQYLHIDVMDGTFVPPISFGLPVISSIRKNCSLFFDVHLMIVRPEKHIEEFAEAGADSITFHYESAENVYELIDQIRACKKKVGMSIKPATPVSDILCYLDEIDMLLIMTVEPGYGGQSFITETLDKIREARKYINANNLSVNIQVDGGIKKDNIAEIAAAGANVFVAGSAVFKGDICENISALYKNADSR